MLNRKLEIRKKNINSVMKLFTFCRMLIVKNITKTCAFEMQHYILQNKAV